MTGGYNDHHFNLFLFIVFVCKTTKLQFWITNLAIQFFIWKPIYFPMTISLEALALYFLPKTKTRDFSKPALQYDLIFLALFYFSYFSYLKIFLLDKKKIFYLSYPWPQTNPSDCTYYLNTSFLKKSVSLIFAISSEREHTLKFHEIKFVVKIEIPSSESSAIILLWNRFRRNTRFFPSLLIVET